MDIAERAGVGKVKFDDIGADATVQDNQGMDPSHVGSRGGVGKIACFLN